MVGMVGMVRMHVQLPLVQLLRVDLVLQVFQPHVKVVLRGVRFAVRVRLQTQSVCVCVCMGVCVCVCVCVSVHGIVTSLILIVLMHHIKTYFTLNDVQNFVDSIEHS